MKPEELHRSWITAVAQGDNETAKALRARSGAHGPGGAEMYLRGVTTVCVHHRLGVPSEDGGIDHDLLARLVDDMRDARLGRRLPGRVPGFIYVEGAIRGLYGEAHLFDELGPATRDAALSAVLRFLYSTEPGIRTRFDNVITEAQQLMTRWVLG